MKQKSTRIASSGLVAAMLVAGIGTMSTAATQTNGSDDPLHIFDGVALTLVEPSATIPWDKAILASSSSSSLADLVCPAESERFRPFLSAVGQERNPGQWKGSKAVSPFFDATKTIAEENISPNELAGSDLGSVRTAGSGNYSLGVACTNLGGTTVQKAYYRTITMTSASGAFTAAATADQPVSTPTPTPTPIGSGSVAMSANTIAAQDGTLSLSVPANAAAVFGTPTLVNNKSTTTGVLPNVSVTDERVVTKRGWIITANVADFVNSITPATTISKVNLGMLPRVVSTDATGVTAGLETAAGNANYPFTFASASASNGVGSTTIAGDLTFVSPVDKAAGTYTSTLTLTLVSR